MKVSDDVLLDMLCDIEPKYRYVDPESGNECFDPLGFVREFSTALLDRATKRIGFAWQHEVDTNSDAWPANVYPESGDEYTVPVYMLIDLSAKVDK